MNFKPLVIANWKMNKTVKESVELASKIKGSQSIQVILAPSFVSLKPIDNILKGRSIKLAAQNVYPLDSGDFTGEISPGMIKDAGCDYVIVGHSERRFNFGETEDMINNKVLVSLSYGLKVVLCIGETYEATRVGINEDYIAIQLSRDLYKVKNFKNLIVAYEPVWSLNSSKSADSEYIEKMHSFIKNYMVENFETEVSIIYGGNVNENNCKSIMNLKNVDGLLIGEASLKAESLNKIIKVTENLNKNNN